MSGVDPLLAVLRGSHVAALISAFGTLAFLVLAGPGDLARTLRRLAWGSMALALALGFGWFVLTARAIAGAATLSETIAALRPVAEQTQFGAWLLARLGLLVATGLLCCWAPRIAALPAGIALALQPELAHAGAIGGAAGAWLTGSEALHVLAAGAWLGGLAPLGIAISVLPAPEAARLCRRFSGVALSAVLILAGSAAVQGALLFGGWAGLTTTAYGHVALIKLALFLGALSLGALNRLWLTGRIAAVPEARWRMRRSVAAEAVLGLAIVLAAGWLASLEPGIGMHSAGSASPGPVPPLAIGATAIALALTVSEAFATAPPRLMSFIHRRGTMP